MVDLIPRRCANLRTQLGKSRPRLDIHLREDRSLQQLVSQYDSSIWHLYNHQLTHRSSVRIFPVLIPTREKIETMSQEFDEPMAQRGFPPAWNRTPCVVGLGFLVRDVPGKYLSCCKESASQDVLTVTARVQSFTLSVFLLDSA